MGIEKEMLRQKLQSLRPHSSQGITEQLENLIALHNPKTLASYTPTRTEPDVSDFNSQAAKTLKLVFPRVFGENLVFCSGPLSEGKFGILEPQGEEVDEIDLMMIPAMAVDKLGNRLGKGRGFYDRYLANRQGLFFAVVFDSEVLNALPVDSHDVKVTGFVTPSKLVTF
jgi:5-formyltetrahydrofolate cyclo-ligase